MDHTDFICCKDTTVSADAVVSYYVPDSQNDTPYLLPKIKRRHWYLPAPLAEDGEIKQEVMGCTDHSFRDLYVENLVDCTVEFINE